jgi:hypothetical protein
MYHNTRLSVLAEPALQKQVTQIHLQHQQRLNLALIQAKPRNIIFISDLELYLILLTSQSNDKGVIRARLHRWVNQTAQLLVLKSQDTSII